MSRAEAAVCCGNTDPLITSIVCSLFIVKKNIQFHSLCDADSNNKDHVRDI